MAHNSLRSFASGMIFATSIVTAVYFSQPSGENEKIIESNKITEQKVQEFLNNKDYISIPRKTYDELKNQQTSSEKIENTNKEDKSAHDSNTSNQPVQPESTANDTATNSTTNNQSVQQEPAANSGTNNQAVKQEPATNSTPNNQGTQTNRVKQGSIVYTLRIQPGMSGFQIGKKLQSAGIVKNGVEFSKYLASKNLQSTIQPGAYKLNSDMSYEQIGTIITTKK